jgi:hypothetical protein
MEQNPEAPQPQPRLAQVYQGRVLVPVDIEECPPINDLPLRFEE